jgi:hypothetical protein
VEVAVVPPPVGQPVDQARIPVEREHDRLVRREDHVEHVVGEAVRMLLLRLQPHQVDDVDDAQLDLGEVVPEQVDGGERLECRDVAN